MSGLFSRLPGIGHELVLFEVRVPASDQLRQRLNPFHPYLEERVHALMGVVHTQ